MTRHQATFRTVFASVTLATALFVYTVPQAAACPEISVDATGAAVPQSDLEATLAEFETPLALALALASE
jgi:hypothetical protein